MYSKYFYFSELETNCVSLERVLEYIKGNPQEAPWHNDDFENHPNPNWPSEGKIHFINYHTKYREGLEPVLKGKISTCITKLIHIPNCNFKYQLYFLRH